jgi:hypothetical protein
MYNYFFFIYSCKKYLKKATVIYDLVSNKLPDCKTYIIYGNPALQKYEIIDDKYLVLNVGDNYEDLTEKTLCLLKTTLLINPAIKGIFKCDDDIIPNICYLNNTIEVLQKTEIDYMGMSIKIGQRHSMWHYNKCSSKNYNKPIFVPESNYATGPIYYLGIKSYRLIPFTCCLSTIFLILETSDGIIDDPRKDFSTFGISLGQCFTVIA